MKSRLLWKLLGINILTIAVVILIVWLAIDYLASNYFMTLMKNYNISPTDVNQMFLDATHRSLIWATLATLTLAVILSFLLTRKVLTPLSQITATTKRIAGGNYESQVPISSNDEIGELAAAFNQMAESLQRVEQLRKSMVIDVAHELRTPLTNTRGYIEALRDKILPPSQETFELLHDETLRLVRLIEDLLQLARADASRGTLHQRKVNLQNLTSQALDIFQPKFAEREITVQAIISEVEGQVVADPEKLSQVLTNLFQNAWQYTPQGGHIRVFTERLPGKVKVVFANTGDGIAEKDLPFIFERFYRGEKSRSRDHGGAGIGLAIVKELIEAHGGEVGAENTPAETRIWFTLPD
jgi:two-component system sensor histidine kinase BaeS